MRCVHCSPENVIDPQLGDMPSNQRHLESSGLGIAPSMEVLRDPVIAVG